MKRLTEKQKYSNSDMIWNILTHIHPEDAMEIMLVVSDRFVTEYPTAADSEISARDTMINWLEWRADRIAAA